MNRKILVTVLSVGALAVASVFGVIAYRTANAAAPVAVLPASYDATQANYGMGGGIRGGYISQDLANALGITVEQLNTAATTANNAALDQAVKDGLITQAQADQLKTRGNVFPFGGRMDGWLSQSGIDYNALLANALGISVDKLQAVYITAFNTRIDAAVTAGNMTQAQADLVKGEYALTSSKTFQTAMQSAYQAAVKQAVTDGVITQAQADAILKNANSMGFPGLKGFDGGFRGPHGGFGGERPGWDGGNVPVNPAAPQSPSPTPSGGA